MEGLERVQSEQKSQMTAAALQLARLEDEVPGLRKLAASAEQGRLAAEAATAALRLALDSSTREFEVRAILTVVCSYSLDAVSGHAKHAGQQAYSASHKPVCLPCLKMLHIAQQLSRLLACVAAYHV